MTVFGRIFSDLLNQRKGLPGHSDKPNCWCYNCNADYVPPGEMLPLTMTRMILCPKCGNKRCPHSTDHNEPCTGSNAPGQPGSRYQ